MTLKCRNQQKRGADFLSPYLFRMLDYSVLNAYLTLNLCQRASQSSISFSLT